MNEMRCFIGMHVAEPDRIAMVQEKLDPGNFRFTDTDNMHLTLVFLGDILDQRAHQICEILEKSGFDDLVVKPARIIGLPSNKNARVVALVAENEHLPEYHDRLCKSLHFHDDRKFIPHITIARARKPMNIERWLGSVSELGEQLFLERPTLYRSTLTQRGPIHEKIC
ncbi:MAG: RNA 2',3'-cyclic phosphodiesterase [Candidatus Thermoplasmatota archaeon]|jgi:2'-5' RNA ligase|nr:RNA 2',3'-cyclic phosphodiesterase [Candidatus Thermoplasmatota archaeon]